MRIFGRPVPPDDGELYAEQAKKTNDLWHADGEGSGSVGAAKKIIVLEKDGCPDGEGVLGGDGFDLHWRLRTQSVTGKGPASVQIKKLEPRELGLDEVVTQSYELKEQEAAISLQSPCAEEAMTATSALIKNAQKSPASQARSEILRLLHKLQLTTRCVMICVADGKEEHDKLVATRLAKFGPQGPALAIFTRRSFQGYLARLNEANERLRTCANINLTAGDAANIIAVLKESTAYFRNLALSLPEITTKLMTKPSTQAVYQPHLLARLTALITKGLAKLTPEISAENFERFLWAFTHASRCYPLCSDETRRVDLLPMIDKTVISLLALKRAGAPALFQLISHVQKQIQNEGDEGLLATLEALLLNEQLASFVEQGLEGAQSCAFDRTLDQVIKDRRAPLWMAGSTLLARRPHRNFTNVIQALVKPTQERALNSDKINFIFGLLNQRLSLRKQQIQDPQLLEKEHQTKNYRRFITLLLQEQSLHHILTATLDPEQQQQACENLSLLYNADISTPAECDMFLSTSAFIAASQIHFAGTSFSRAAASLLRHNRLSFVQDKAVFFELLSQIYRGFQAGLPELSQVVLASLGESSRPKRLPHPVSGKLLPCTSEEWLRDDIVPSYFSVLDLVAKCFPVVWGNDDFLSLPNSDGSLVMTPSGHLAETAWRDGVRVLADPLGKRQSEPFVASETYGFFGSTATFFAALERFSRRDDIKFGIATLVSHHEGFKILNLSQDKIDQLKDLSARMLKGLRPCADDTNFATEAQFSSQKPEGFIQRVTAVGNFFESTAVFRHSYLLAEAKRRLFSRAELTASGRRILDNEALAASTDLAAIETALSSRLFEVGFKAVKELLGAQTTPAALCRATGQIEALVRREIDFQTFSTEAMVGAFNAHHAAAGTTQSFVQVSVDEVEALRQRLYAEAEAGLKQRGIDYIMPNQALAAHLCSKPELTRNHILLKMGTGQGKSLVIAAAAANEAKSLQRQQFVIVLTAYDHLAQHDHKTAQDFFSPKSIKSACLVKVGDVSQLTTDTKVIYASARSLQSIATAIMTHQIDALTRNVFAPNLTKELAFLETLYKGTHRYILDEYDLMLNDLDYAMGNVVRFSAATLDRQFVADNQACSPEPSPRKDYIIFYKMSHLGKSAMAAEVSISWILSRRDFRLRG